MTKEEIKKLEDKLVEMTQLFCDQKLDDDYKYLCEKLIRKLGRKRDVPFQRGKIEIWAAAIIHALGSINFLFDRSLEPYVTTDEISEYFGAKNSTVSNKAREIKDLLKLGYFNHEFSTKKMLEDNPFNNLVMLNGLIVPLDSLPPVLQDRVKEVRANGGDIEFTTE
jgi:hypothetical protein